MNPSRNTSSHGKRVWILPSQWTLGYMSREKLWYTEGLLGHVSCVYIYSRNVYILSRPLSKQKHRRMYLAFVTKLHNITLCLYFAHLFIYVLLLSPQQGNYRCQVLFTQCYNICTYHHRWSIAPQYFAFMFCHSRPVVANHSSAPCHRNT
jgi:hypothetical protein